MKYRSNLCQYTRKTYRMLIYGLITLLTLNGIDTYSQSVRPQDYINYNEVIGKSPTASQFLRYDELPVSEYTGIPSISIPLYTIEMDNIQVPLTLSYHAGGLKVTQEANWVGLGWDIPSVASVTQIVKDEDDLYCYNSTHSNDLYPDWQSNGATSHRIIPFENCWTTGQLSNEVSPKIDVTKQFGYYISTAGWFVLNERFVRKYEDLSNYIKDSEPDIFKINIQGEILNCIVDRMYSTTNPNFVVLNKKGYIVNYNKNSGWEITDPQGTKYYLTTKSEQKNLSMNRTFNMQSAVWYVDRIVSTKGKMVIFNYLQSGTFTNRYKTNAKTIEVSRSGYNIPIPGVNSIPPGILHSDVYVGSHPSFNSKDGYGSLSEYVIEDQQIYLKSIEFPYGKVEFTLSSRTDISGKKKLDAITVKNINNQQVKRVSFSYIYYPGEDVWSKKLQLTSVQLAGEGPYKFTYDSQTLPAMNSYAVDYWGYYNGNANNKSLAPNPLRWKTKNPNMLDCFSTLNENSEPEVTKNNHSARIQYAKAGILEKIEYPTGGKTAFEYELNEFTNYWVPDYDSLTNVISKGNGIRIKGIKYLDSDNRILKQEQYSYQGGKTIQPISFFQSIEYYFVHNQDLANAANITYTNIPSTKMTLLQCSNSGNYADNPLSSFNGIGYDKVTKTTIAQDNSNNGQIVTFYHNTPDLTGPLTTWAYGGCPVMSLPSIKNSNKPINGLPYKKTYYNASGDKVSQEGFEYSNTNQKPSYYETYLFYGVKIGGYSTLLQECAGGSTRRSIGTLGRHLLGYYPIFDFESLLTKKTNIQYFGNDSIITTEEHTYNNHRTNHFLQSTRKYDSFGYSNNWYYKYPHDFPKIPIYSEMVNKNILTPKVEQYEINYQGTTVNMRKIDYDKYYSYEIKSVQSKQKVYDTSTGFTTEVVFNQYDRMGNILEYTTLDEVSVFYLWSYGGQYPIAEIRGVSYMDMLKAVQITFGVDNNEILSEVPYEHLGYSWEQDLRNHPLLKNALVTTYTYKPLVGMLTSTDPAGITTYYEYDDFGRLKRTYTKKLFSKDTIQSYDYHYQNQ